MIARCKQGSTVNASFTVLLIHCNTQQNKYLFDKPPWALIKFLDLESGYLFEAGRIKLNFHHFQQVQYVYFATKQWMIITKREELTKQGFCKILWRKLRHQGNLSLVLIQFQSHATQVNKWILWCYLQYESRNCTPVNKIIIIINTLLMHLNSFGVGGGRGVGWGWALFQVWVEGEGDRVGVGAYSNITYITNLVVFVQSAAAPLTVWQSHPCILRLNVK